MALQISTSLTELRSPTPAVQRRAMAKAITLLESTRADHRAQADALLTDLLPFTGESIRVGVSGVPGVGKSTFIEVLGLYLIAHGHRVAVLAVDPSSSVSGGSILGDKTRMEQLSVHPQAFIRPSPASGTLGGVAEKTRECMLVCEAAGYDLQAIKKGVMELADLVVINKADIDPDAATRAQAQITSALRLLGLHGNPERLGWSPQVVPISALQGTGISQFWEAVLAFRTLQADSGRFATRRQSQALSWMWERIDAGLKQSFKTQWAVGALLPDLSAQVANGSLAASTAARQLLHAYGQSPGQPITSTEK